MRGRWWSLNLGWHVVLALLLLWMQQAGLRHHLQHALEDDGEPTHAACLVCLAHHADDQALGSAQATAPAHHGTHVLVAAMGQPQHQPGVHLGYLGRAPPVAA